MGATPKGRDEGLYTVRLWRPSTQGPGPFFVAVCYCCAMCCVMWAVRSFLYKGSSPSRKGLTPVPRLP